MRWLLKDTGLYGQQLWPLQQAVDGAQCGSKFARAGSRRTVLQQVFFSVSSQDACGGSRAASPLWARCAASGAVGSRGRRSRPQHIPTRGMDDLGEEDGLLYGSRRFACCCETSDTSINFKGWDFFGANIESCISTVAEHEAKLRRRHFKTTCMCCIVCIADIEAGNACHSS